MLGYVFPDDAEAFTSKAEEAALSRLYGGIHYPLDNEGGLGMGHRIGKLVVDRASDDGAGASTS